MAGRAGRAITRIPAFWDTSALVPLCARQDNTARVISLHRYEAVVWWATPAEIASAVGRLLRMKEIDPGQGARARKLAHILARYWSVILPSEALLARAIRQLGVYDLRAADSFQLAAALEWCEGAAQGRVFLTADQKLREAARLCGFDTGQI
jgi:predicted nucleic acid-binding protein